MFLSLYFSLMAHTRCKLRVIKQATISDMKNMEIGMPSNVSFREIKRRTICFSNCFSNASAETVDDWISSLSFAWNQLI